MKAKVKFYLLLLVHTFLAQCLEKYRSNSISYGLPHKALILL